MPPLSNAERQRRFRDVTLKERQLKVDAFDLLIAAIDAGQPVAIPLPDGRQLKAIQREGQCRIQIVVDRKLQSEIALARFRHLNGE